MIGYIVSGFAPAGDMAWLLAGDLGRREALREAARLLLSALNHQLMAGVDRFGRPLRPIAHRTAADRAADVNPVTGQSPYSPMGRANPMNAPLMATGSRSRTVTLLRVDIDGGALFVHWADDAYSGVNWGAVLARHAAGFYQKFRDGWGYVPPRDVLGIAPQYDRWFRQQFDAWWIRHRRRLAAPGLARIKQAEGLALKTPPVDRRPLSVTPSPALTHARRPPVPPRGERIVRREVPLGSVIEGLTGPGNPFGRALRPREKVILRGNR